MKTFLLLMAILLASSVWAGEADVVDVSITEAANRTFSFDVTVQHADEGWDHYADEWEVVRADGAILGTRVLYHPHVNEQPFTRSLNDLKIPQGSGRVTLSAHDSVHGYGGREISVDVPD